MDINKVAGIQPNQEQPQQIESNSSSPKQLQGRQVQLSPRTKIAMGFAAISALAFTYYATYNYLSPVNNSKPVPYQTTTCLKSDHISRQLAPAKKELKDFCTDPKTIFNEIYESAEFKAISISDMEKRFGVDENSMTAGETRAFYNVIAKANREFGNRAIKDYGVKSPTLNEVAATSCETRHNAKVYIRTRGGHAARIAAKSLDFVRHGSTTGQDCTALFKKYNNNATVILDKAASPNDDVNQFIENLDNGFIFAVSEEFKDRVLYPSLHKIVRNFAHSI